MKNEASKTRTLDIAFVVTPDLLKRLAVILGETSGTLEYTARYSDGTSVHYDKIEDVIGQPNSDERSIISLIAGTGDETIKSAYVNLKKNDSPSLEYTINGAQRDVIYFADQLDDWVAAARQWYSPFFSGPSSPSGAGVILLFAAFLLPIYAWDHLSRLSRTLEKGGAYQSIALPAMIVMWSAEYWILKLFPRGTFAIGQGERRHQFFVYLRRTVLVGSLLSVLMRVLWVLFTRHHGSEPRWGNGFERTVTLAQNSILWMAACRRPAGRTRCQVQCVVLL